MLIHRYNSPNTSSSSLIGSKMHLKLVTHTKIALHNIKNAVKNIYTNIYNSVQQLRFNSSE